MHDPRFEAADAAWRAKGREVNFSFAGEARVGGRHAKEFWTDTEGRLWLFKPVKREGDGFVAFGEEAAYRIGRLIDPFAVEVRVIRLGGRLGSIQGWLTGLKDKPDFAGLDPTKLMPDEIRQIQREQVIDWLISNHDSHPGHFLRGRDSQVHGIDKGQVFKHLGEDRLAIDYHPNARYGSEPPIYNMLFHAVRGGGVHLDPMTIQRHVHAVEEIADDNYLAILRPHAEGRCQGDETLTQAFLTMALARKHGLRRDFENFYAAVPG